MLQVRFYSVTESELTDLRARFRAGRLDLSITDDTFDLGSYASFIASIGPEIDAFRTRQRTAFDAEIGRWAADDASNVAAVAASDAAMPAEGPHADVDL